MGNATTHPLAKPTGLLKAFADPVRLRILNLLADRDEVCVCHLHDALEVPQPTVSRHLAYLRKHGVVATRKEGLWVHYRLAKPTSDLHRMLVACVGSCLSEYDLLKADRERLERLISSCC
jgi:ArsR family transcriptional regulator